MTKKIFKRNGSEEAFDLKKIETAVKKANSAVDKEHKLSDEEMEKVIATVVKKLQAFTSIKVEDIQDIVEQALVKHNKYEVAKAYIIYRDHKKTFKKYTPTEEVALSIISGESDEMRGENANKHIDVNSSVRDYLAGTVCKALFNKQIPKKILDAHKKGKIHWHDSDYYAMNLHNCDLINVRDMLTNGFQMGDTHIETPKTFSTACNLLAQIALIVSGSQYGGQTISWSHLLPIVQRTRETLGKEVDGVLEHLPRLVKDLIRPFKKKIVEELVKNDIYKGVKTYQYQILCHHSSNGQTPFVSNSLCLREAQNDQELKDLAYIIEQILLYRIKGVKDNKGYATTPLFPKYLYWTCDGLNVKKGDPYFYLTELAAKCISLRMAPDINSEKMTREVKMGQIIPSMGCRSLLSQIWEEVTYPLDAEFYWQFVTSSNKKYKGAYGPNFDYARGLGTAAKLPLKGDSWKDVVINFAGNSGWVKEVRENEVVILEPKVYGRWNNGVITINLPYAALEARRDFPEDNEKRKEAFYTYLDDLMDIAHEGLKLRNEAVRKIKAKNSPILWQYGALYRADDPEMTVGEIIDKHPTRPSISLGYVGLFETCEALIDQSNTTNEGRKLSKEVLKYINDKLNGWKEAEGLGYALYGTPEEMTTYKFAQALQKEFGLIEKITDKDYVVNSYHVDPREHIDAFSKLQIEGEYLALSSGGAVSYIETADLTMNPEAIESVIGFMHDHIAYAEVNRIIGICYKCGYQGNIPLSKTEDHNFVFTCPHCGNQDDSQMNVTARLCGYIGKVNAKGANNGRMDDIYHRVIHLE